ncbi:MAG: hypothetical protein HC869_03855 [Rhodospirillales bacterium]|nr:hypothetical protein [Rhodospirillales bacterium]
MGRRSFGREFKLEAVRLGVSVAQATRRCRGKKLLRCSTLLTLARIHGQEF